MNEDCGCCEGIERVTPVSNENRPGLSALVYRAGTHATFLETMLARLTTEELPPPVGDEVQSAGPRPLLALRTRDADDASVAFLDAWATVADVLTFYQERIANEGYLRTANERRSVTELANLVGYRPRPGVSASTYFAYTLEDKAEVTVVAGSKAASTPGPGELPQTFETAEDLYARAEWNVLTPRQTRPQALNELKQGAWPLYLKGTSTNLKPNDPMLIDFGLTSDSVALFRVVAVEPDDAAKRTKVTLQLWTDGARAPGLTTGGTTTTATALETLRDIAERYRDAESAGVNPNTATAGRVLGHVDTLTAGIDSGLTDDVLHQRLDDVLPKLREEHRLAREGGYTKLEPWIGGLVAELSSLSKQLAASAATAATGGSGATNTLNASFSMLAVNPKPGQGAAAKTSTAQAAGQSSLVNVIPLLGALTKEPSAQPRSRQQLAKSVAAAFAPASDNLPRLLGAFSPALGRAIYGAWGAVPVTRRTPAVVYAMRTRAFVFGNTAQPFQERDERGVPVGDPQEWTLFKPMRQTPSTHFSIRMSSRPDPNNDASTITVFNVEVEGPGKVSGSDIEERPFGPTEFDMTLKEDNGTVVDVVHVKVANSLNAVGQPAATVWTFDFRDRDILVNVTADSATLSAKSAGSDPTEFSLPIRFTTGQGIVRVEGDAHMAAGRTPTETAYSVSLDATYNKVLPGSWAVIERPEIKTGAQELIFQRVERVGESTRSDYGMTAKGTQLQLDRKRSGWINPAGGDDFSVIRNTTVFTESEQLELAEVPIDPVKEAVCGGRVELGALVSGLEVGRWLIVTGERADVAQKRKISAAPASTAGGSTGAGSTGTSSGTGSTDANGNEGDDKDEDEVIAGLNTAELVMISGVEQSYDPALAGDRTHTTLLFATPLAYCYRRDTVRIYGNVVRATHGETRTEVLGSGDASKAMQSFTLKQSPLTYVSAPNASGVESTLRARVNDVLWHETDTLAGLKPLDRVYVTKADEAGATTLTFGNGRQGSRLPTGNENVKATYRAGIGKPGNLKAGRINQPTTKPLGVKEVVNPLAATGGADREGRDEARRNAPLAVMALDRLVSTRDYEDFSRTFAGVAKASASRLSDGRRRVVHVTIAGADDAPISKTSDLYKNLREALHKFGDPFQPVELETRYLKTLFVSANVKVHPDYLWEPVETKVRAALLERFSFYGRDLGQDALLSEAVAAAQGVEGVVYVDFDIFDDVAEGVSVEELLRVGEDLKLRTRVHAYLAHVESAAEVGAGSRIRPAQLVLLTPLVPDTLILKEIKR
jgi:hypothetical protein